MDTVEIITLTIGVVTVGLLVSLLVLMRTLYVLVRREQPDPSEPGVPRAD